MTYSPTNICSTIGAVGLNFSVRDGKRWIPNAINRLNIGNDSWRVQKDSNIFTSSKQLTNAWVSLGGIYQSLLSHTVSSGGEKKSSRAISTARLNTLLRLHLQPINVVVYNDPQGKSNLVAGFALRCFQRLSLPDADTQRCAWRHNWYTGGQSITVLSY